MFVVPALHLEILLVTCAQALALSGTTAAVRRMHVRTQGTQARRRERSVTLRPDGWAGKRAASSVRGAVDEIGLTHVYFGVLWTDRSLAFFATPRRGCPSSPAHGEKGLRGGGGSGSGELLLSCCPFLVVRITFWGCRPPGRGPSRRNSCSEGTCPIPLPRVLLLTESATSRDTLPWRQLSRVCVSGWGPVSESRQRTVTSIALHFA